MGWAKGLSEGDGVDGRLERKGKERKADVKGGMWRAAKDRE